MQGTLRNLFTKNSFLKFTLRKQVFSIAFFAISASLVSCGGGGGGPVPLAPELIGEVKGTAFIGTVENGTVDIYSFTGGVRGKSLATTKIKSEPISLDPADKDKLQGSYTVSLQTSSKAILVCLSDATYQEMTQDRLISFNLNEKQELCAVENYVSGSKPTVILSYYSHIAAGLAKYLVTSGKFQSSDAVTSANQEIANWTIFNAVAVNPTNISYSGSVQQNVSASDRAGFANAAISVYSGWVNGVAGIPPKDSTGATNPERFKRYNSILFAQRAYQDIASDGLLDGQSLNGPTGMGPVPLKLSTFRHDIALDMLVMANSPRNKSGLNLQNSFGANLLSYSTDYSLFDHPDAPTSRKPSALNIFGGTNKDDIIDGSKPILNNFIVPKIITGNTKFAVSLTDLKNQAVSVEYRLAAPASNGNPVVDVPIKTIVKNLDSNVGPIVTLDRTIVSFNTINSAPGVTPITYAYADRNDYELRIIVKYKNTSNAIVALPTAVKGFSIKNLGTQIAGPSPVTNNSAEIKGTFNLVATINDSLGINTITLDIDGSPSGVTVSNFIVGSNSNVPIFRIDSTTLVNGSHDFIIKATDVNGTETLSSVLSLVISN
jgi:hypothetical protein